ncbi:hypothetical protein EVAR_95346_1 [Eumeta japonica]|uniref:Uncharacterized protein n=1 Tax=Eumeta variegata TaxID=151549 RepID=A0A4C1UAM8_EUMVA|nr:hypothetical protein EVAR_95346_1 [Eumeta japonica]
MVDDVIDRYERPKNTSGVHAGVAAGSKQKPSFRSRPRGSPHARERDAARREEDGRGAHEFRNSGRGTFCWEVDPVSVASLDALAAGPGARAGAGAGLGLRGRDEPDEPRLRV